VHGDAADQIDQLAQHDFVESGPVIFLGQNALEARVVRLDGDHRIVNQLADGRLFGDSFEVGPSGFFWDPEYIVCKVLVPVLGIAAGPEFASYALDYAAGPDPAVDGWKSVGPQQSKPQPGGMLGVWQTGALTPGPYVLRLKVIDIRAGIRTAVVPVEVTAAP